MCVYLTLFFVFNNFVLLLLSFHLLLYRLEVELLHSSISVSICSMVCIFLFACLCLRMWAFHFIIFISSSYVSMYHFVTHIPSFFYCLLVWAQYTKCHLCRQKRRRQQQQQWLNKYVCTIISMFFRRCHSTKHRRHKLSTVCCVCVCVWEQWRKLRKGRIYTICTRFETTWICTV